MNLGRHSSVFTLHDEHPKFKSQHLAVDVNTTPSSNFGKISPAKANKTKFGEHFAMFLH